MAADQPWLRDCAPTAKAGGVPEKVASLCASSTVAGLIALGSGHYTVRTELSHLVILDLGRREIMRVGPSGREHEHDMPRRTLIWEPLPYIFALRKRHEGENSSLAA